MPAGRPTKYNWEELEPLMDKAIDEGMYIEELANYLGIEGNTLRAWEAEHPEFLRAVKKVREACQRRIAKLLDAHAYGGIEKGNGSVAIFIAKNVLGWRDRSEVEQTVKQTQEISVNIGGARRSSDEDDAADKS